MPATVTKNSELVFGIVAPIGTDAVKVAENLASQLKEFNYSVETVRLSDHIEPFSQLLGLDCKLEDIPEFNRIKTRIDAANAVCREFNRRADERERNAMLALAAVREISASRNKRAPDEALLNEAHILVTLKRSEEVEYLRSIYGHGFHLIGVFAPEKDRVKHLHRHEGMSEQQAKKLVEIDSNDRQAGGQRTQEAFHLSDVFLDVSRDGDDWKRQLGRFLDVLFSHPYKTPTRDEQGMFMAHSAALRSAQFGRQVGAAITSANGDILSLGCNEVPKAGGGQYWDRDPGDERDHLKGKDSNDVRKGEILDEIMKAIPEEIIKALPDEMKKDLSKEILAALQDKLSENAEIRQVIRKTSLFGITEFGRAVHAEMEAILSCARKGISTVGATLYTTTFPCHNCARHIVGAGIAKVVYIEPYPKSKAKQLHEDAIHLGESEPNCENAGKVPFVPFVGISPSKYSSLFTATPMYSQKVDRKLADGRAINWQRARTQLRLSMVPISYIERETRAISRLKDSLKQLSLSLE